MADAYDPAESEDKRRAGQYITRKDIRLIGIVLLILAIAAWPLYLYLLRQTHNALCGRNMRKIASALLNYEQDFEGRLPYAYETAGYGSNAVGIRGDGYAYTWQWQLNRYIANWEAFTCPAAKPGEESHSSDGSEVHSNDYGMLWGYSGVDGSTIIDPGSKVLIADSSNRGANGTFDPSPLTDPGGNPLKNDGFLLGFDNGNERPNAQTKFATRLAFPGSKNGKFDEETDSRHPGGNIHIMFADGHVRSLNAKAARVNQVGDSFGPWDVPKPTRH